MSEESYLTAEGAARLKEELARLKGPERDAISKRLREAISQGDLSENADYHKAKEDQSFLEGRILELTYLLQNAVIIDERARAAGVVDVGATVTVQEEDFEPETYQLVGAKEADPRGGRISNESPFGRALLGARVGETVTAETPGGQVHLKVLKIE
jgi:transcription elongation factor GreA